MISRSVASRPAPPLQMPDTSPTVSMAEITAMKHMPMMMAVLNSTPHLKGTGSSNIPARATLPKLTCPIAQATT